MDNEDSLNLRPGDEVLWTDPDGEGDCSRVFRIRSVEIRGDVIRISGTDGSELECLACELS